LFLTDEGIPYAKLKRQSGFQTKTAWRNLRERVAKVVLRLARLKRHQAKLLDGTEREEMISKAQELEGRGEVLRSVTPHWGRHNLASHAFIKGLDTEKVRRLGNWQTDAMVRRYQHLKPEFGKELANVVEFPKTRGTPSRTTRPRRAPRKTD
jgi:site-specific recombinase XerD